jgi:DNA polymerase I-like protein with 3'-5' exonuclease and polymerase domains
LFPVHDELLLDIKRNELDQVIQLLKNSFKDVLKTPIGKLDLSNTLPISGTLEWGKSWLVSEV